MYYELYIDVLFLVNFMMDFILLLSVKEITKMKTKNLSIILASLTGALLTCLVVCFSINKGEIFLFLAQIFIGIIMVRIGFEWKDRKHFMKSIFVLYLVGVLLAGMLQYVQQYLKLGSLFFFLTFISYFLLKIIWKFICHITSYQSKWYEVELYLEEECVKMKALLDTGNHLQDPYTRAPVSIVEKKRIAHIYRGKLDSIEYKSPRYIPYHALGKDGVLLTISAKKLHICGEKDVWIENPRIGVSDDCLSYQDDYQMILNPDML